MSLYQFQKCPTTTKIRFVSISTKDTSKETQTHTHTLLTIEERQRKANSHTDHIRHGEEFSFACKTAAIRLARYTLLNIKKIECCSDLMYRAKRTKALTID